MEDGPILVLSRHRDEGVTITGTDGQRTVVTVVEIRGDKIRLGFDAAKDVTIHRNEVQEIVDREREQQDFGGPVS